MAKKESDEWKEKEFHYDGWLFIMTYNSKQFTIRHEITGKVLTSGDF